MLLADWQILQLIIMIFNLISLYSFSIDCEWKRHSVVGQKKMIRIALEWSIDPHERCQLPIAFFSLVESQTEAMI